MLFDDLPQETKGSTSSSLKQEEHDAQTKIAAAAASTTSIQQQGEATVEETDSHVTSENKSKPKSLVDTIGNAGTTMAFVPTALRKRKAPVVNTLVKPPRKSQVKSQTSLDLVADTFNSTSNHDAEECSATGKNVNGQHDERLKIESNHHLIADKSDENNERGQDTDEEYKEPQHLTDLHASVRSADMYHPMMPNDYLAYRQRKENELLQANLEKQAQKTLEMQRKLREQIEEERRKALDSGDAKKIIESRLTTPVENTMISGIGRGRGRGLSNLPAWLVKKQQEENQ
eukprot:CAMPEP_0176487448 /NCGR_PEP_ID=MMETSP0200_2-20121128/6137_1 /TAXON_ID=947934 /ORGANISM="Chaetoceros sp., Strain GSL56" /LENGTH=287 /DNA_ID=CAMNT_0017884277 /DNA_START=64 /DNA_END=927 /DNA_ORIENTATION=-